jgi:hypothetical protein
MVPRVFSVVACVLALVLLSGCATIRGFPDPPDTSTAEFPAVGYQLGPDAITQYNKAPDARKKLVRNEIIDARMAEIDRKFAEFERALYREGIGFGVGTDWLVLALTAGATVAGGVDTKTALAAISTAVVGAHAAYSRDALFEKTMPALMAQMVAQRETIRASILMNEESPVEAYTLFAGLSQLNKQSRTLACPSQNEERTYGKGKGCDPIELETRRKEGRQSRGSQDQGVDGCACVLHPTWFHDAALA